MISTDPLGALSSWNDSVDFCGWNGVTCSTRHQRVTVLDLRSMQLSGPISPHVGNLSFLRELYLSNNSFTREIPPQLGRLHRLERLYLLNNSFTGDIPAELSSCSNLVMFNAANNRLTGEIPREIGSLNNLQNFVVSFNSMRGNIPASFGNMSSLRVLSASNNFLSGKLPATLGQLKNLSILYLPMNGFSGEIPSSIFNLSSLSNVYFGFNQLQGSLPPDMGISLPNLQSFDVALNYLSGTVPVSFSNASNLEQLQLQGNDFRGGMPSLGRSPNLFRLIISNNSLGNAGEEDDLSFISSLSNASNFQALIMDQNNFGGPFPADIGNLSALQILYISQNKLSGELPMEMQNLNNLQRLVAFDNNFSGTIPSTIGKLQNLEELDLSNNSFTGNVPSSIGNLTELLELKLARNNLQGEIPSRIGNCTKLITLDLSRNNFSGLIPTQVMSLASLSVFLNLSHNDLTGSIPVEVGNLQNMGGLDLSHNGLSGSIPSSLGSCVRLESVNLQGNQLQGAIPSSLSSLRGIQRLDISSNNLSGQIPEFLEGMNLLQILNLSHNSFEGELSVNGVLRNDSVVSVIGNSKLCGGVAEFNLPPCSFSRQSKALSHKLKIVISTICSLLVLTFMGSCLLIFWIKRRGKQDRVTADDLQVKLSYQRLHKATDGFSTANLVGVGSFGSVYKGVLDDKNGATIAVKVFNLERRGASKSFKVECEALKNIRHRNLVRIVTVCSSVDYRGNDFKALVYEFLANGSLEEWLHPVRSIDGQTKSLNFLQRLSVAVDVASAVDYLHHQYGTPIVHCDIKPSNVLLDEDMGGRVGDFGLAKFLQFTTADTSSTGQGSSTLGIKGTVGYAPPEYGMGNEVSIQGDVYSYGILLLEMFTGRRPTEESFKEGANLHGFVKHALFEGSTTEVVDPTLLNELLLDQATHCSETSSSNNLIPEESLVSILKIGVTCSSDSPHERISMSEVLSGSISEHIGNLSFLVELNLINNSFSNGIPPEIGRLRRMQRLLVFNNSLSGVIPSTISGCSALTVFHAANNKLAGELPMQIGSLKKLQQLIVPVNGLTGSIPPSFGNLSSLQRFVLGNNRFSGSIMRLSSLSVLLNLSHNQFTGILPYEVGSLTNLETLDLSHNMLSGNIPGSLGSCVRLELLNLQYNLMQGAIPSSLSSVRGVRILDISGNNLSVTGNNKLCGGIAELHLPACQFNQPGRRLSRKWKILISTISSLLFVSFTATCLLLCLMRSLDFLQRLNVAIDVASALDYLQHQCQTPIVHCDLKPSNVLLDDDMTGHVGDFGLARFLSSLDKRSFEGRTSSVGVRGTVGYAPPEYGMGNLVSIQGDVYSYGILLLEMFTGRRPTDESLGAGLNLHNFVQFALLEKSAAKVVDQALFDELLLGVTSHASTSSSEYIPKSEKSEELLISIFEVGLACSSDIPQERLGIREAALKLVSVRNKLVGSALPEGESAKAGPCM
ncbi:unnamed protein product [Linum tenue]|uniref:non-specific serine/threonine protein kinase n=1 Tax=Linum tenue TaxID=586396 RepID=A0AAV0K1F0_9ROSI|nr:unnamed protein product [Linum tenue]